MVKQGNKRITLTLKETTANEIERLAKEMETTKSFLIELWLEIFVIKKDTK